MGEVFADRRTTAALLLIAAAGLGLRIAAARGGLWLDEAWSAVSAADSGTILGVLFGINHDNNHHLNTLWLQLVGIGAPPLVMRGLSIATGTATILVAAAIASGRGATAALLAALLFAVSPMLVTFGSEARGYAPMILAFFASVWLVQGWIKDPDQAAPSAGLALATFFGMFSQLGMVFGLAALLGWTFLALLPRLGSFGALTRTLRVSGPSLVVTGLIFLAIWIAAHRSPTGFRFGNLDPFSLSNLIAASAQAMEFGLGVSGWAAAVVVVTLLILVVLASRRDNEALHWLYLLACLGLPAGAALLQLPNTGYARYFWLPVVASLLASAIAAGVLMEARQRWLPIVAMAAVLLGSLMTDLRDMQNLRGDPAAPIRIMKAITPDKALVAITHPRSEAVLRVAAAQADYSLTITAAPCPASPFLFVDRDGDQPFPDPATRCGVTYREVARGDPSGLSGNHWRLYRR